MSAATTTHVRPTPGAPPTIARRERFSAVPSTNDVVRAWLAAGEPEICLAVADEQTAGRGRNGRTWMAPAGAGLLLSLGFRPSWLAPEAAWRLAATASLAMADAAENVAGLADRAIRLKWPNDLVIAVDDRGRAVEAQPAAADRDGATGAISIRKLGGVLGETDGLGTADPRVVVGMGINADWRAIDFPPDLFGSMTSLRAASGDRRVDVALLLEAFLSSLEVGIAALRGGRFDAVDWIDRQVTTGRELDLELPDGAVEHVVGLGVDPASGALRIAGHDEATGERSIVVGEIRHVRIAGV